MSIDGNIYNCPFCNNGYHIFRYLNDEESKKISEQKHVVRYKVNETIFKQDSPLTHVISFDQGLAKMHYQGPDQKDFIIRLIKPFEIITGVDLFHNNKHHYTLTTVEETSLCMIDIHLFKSLLKNNPAFNEAYLDQIHRNIAESYIKMISLSRKNAIGRIAESILYLAGEIYHSDRFTTNLSKIELAEMSGVSRESAFKALHELTSDGIIHFEGSWISILNKPLLINVSEKG